MTHSITHILSHTNSYEYDSSGGRSNEIMKQNGVVVLALVKLSSGQNTVQW